MLEHRLRLVFFQRRTEMRIEFRDIDLLCFDQERQEIGVVAESGRDLKDCLGYLSIQFIVMIDDLQDLK